MHLETPSALPSSPVPTGAPVASYVLPLCTAGETEAELTELAAYLGSLCRLVEVVVIDGSPPPEYAAHAAAFPDEVRHAPPDPEEHCRNGKVAGVRTGLRLAGHERVVIADDDVRYDDAALLAVLERLDGHAVVRPQNYFDPLPWHALLDSGRSLLNRAIGGDWPGTLAIRRDALPQGNYRGDILFENLELVRTIRARGGGEAVARDILVRRLPPTTRVYLGQRVRQAYDELARPWRLVLGLAVAPVVTVLARGRRWPTLALAAAGVVGAAEAGRRREGGTAVFPAAASLLAPLWVLERGLTSWLALVEWSRGGASYRGARFRYAASSLRELSRGGRPAESAATSPVRRAVPPWAAGRCRCRASPCPAPHSPRR